MPRGKRGARAVPHARATAPGVKTAASSLGAAKPLLYLCFFASGAAGLTLEIVWSKYL